MDVRHFCIRDFVFRVEVTQQGINCGLCRMIQMSKPRELRASPCREAKSIWVLASTFGVCERDLIREGDNPLPQKRISILKGNH